jgi:hypothetical protein
MNLRVQISRLLAFTAVLVASSLSAFSQVEEQAWTNNVTGSGKAIAVASDVYGYTYTLIAQPSVSSNPWYVEITDRWGNPDYSRQIEGEYATPAFGMAVDPYSGGVFVVGSNASSTDLYGFLANGFSFNSSVGAVTPLAVGVDTTNGQVSLVFSYENELNVFNVSEDGQEAYNYEEDTSMNATSAFVDTNGNVLAAGKDAAGDACAKSYNWLGAVSWTRKYPNTATDTYSIGAIAEDTEGEQYLAVNDVNGGVTSFQLVAIYAGSSNYFSLGGDGAAHELAVADQQHMYVAGQGSSAPFLDFYNSTGEQWGTETSVQTMACPADGSGSVLFAYYYPTSKQILARKYNSAGSQEYAVSVAANSTSDIGAITWVMDNNSWPSAFLCGETTPTTGDAAFTTKILDGPALKSFSVPASIVAGASFTSTVTLTTASTGVYGVTAGTGQGILYVTGGGVEVPAHAASAPMPGTTEGVDRDTHVTLTVTDQRGVSLTQNVLVKHAALTALSLSSSSVTPDALAVGTAKLNGEAGPSGVPITITSDSSYAVVPDSITILQNATSGAFRITTKPVSANVTAHITVTSGSASFSEPLTLTPAVFSLLSPATDTITGGASLSFTAEFTGNLAADATVTLKSSDPSVPVPPSVTAAAGSPSEAFTVTTKAVTSTKTVTVTATSGSITKTSVITVNP